MPTAATTTTSVGPARPQRGVAGTALRFAAVLALSVSAVVHVMLAGSYGAGQSGITLGKEFVVQAVLTAVVAVWLMLRDTRSAWGAGVLLMAGTLGAILIAHTGGGLPAVGPLPGLREQTYDGPQLVTMAAEAGYLVLAALRALVAARRDARGTPTTPGV